MTANDLRKKYLDFFVSKGHKVIPSAPLVPENDPTTLFTSSGMQPLVPYLLGQPHSEGSRLVDSQPSFRAQDIEEVGDNRHTTFFEMLGNWSLGDYFKKEQLAYFWEFLTDKKTGIGLNPEKIYVSIFAGDDKVPKDEESKKNWLDLGVVEDHIFEYDVNKNWWSRSGPPSNMPAGEIGGPDSEVFFEFTQVKHDPKFGEKCHPNCDCGRFLEIGNSVFMQYQKQADGSLKELAQKNVDFGGGLERLVAATNNDPDIFNTDLFSPIIQTLEELSTKKYQENKEAFRIIADHIKASTFILNNGITPSNKAQGYVLRRLIRRAINSARTLEISTNFTKKIVPIVQKIYKKQYSNIIRQEVLSIIEEEENKFRHTLENGLDKLHKFNNNLAQKDESQVPTPQKEAEYAFDFYQNYGLPIDIYLDELKKKTNLGYSLKTRQGIIEEFNKYLYKHQDLSRSTSKGMFKGGLGGDTLVHRQYHTATHLLHQALRDILGDHVKQAGSNNTPERLRFDFNHDKPLTNEQIKKVEDVINKKIQESLPVTSRVLAKDDALKLVTVAMFADRYPDQVTVYSIGDYSKEICGGPHVSNTQEIGKIEVGRQESVGSGVRRIYLKLANGDKKDIQRIK